MREMKRVLVAYSGGVDSAYVALIASQELASDALCVLGVSPSLSDVQKEQAEQIAKSFSFNFKPIQTDEMQNPDYQANPSNRCYFCKSELYGKLTPVAAELGISHIVDGSNTDDIGDYRPGRTAATENNVRSPLIEVGMSKAELRELSKKHGLPTWDKPSSPCLSSRIAYGVPVTIERLSKVEKGEEYLRALGLKVFRVRNHGDIARIEIALPEMDLILSIEKFEEISNYFRSLGFKYVTLDLEGFRSGAMNEVLVK